MHDLVMLLVSFFEPPTHIIDNIYLGNAYNAAYYYGLKKNNIKMIINVTKEISKYYPEYFTYYQLIYQKSLNVKNYIINLRFNYNIYMGYSIYCPGHWYG